MSNRNLTASQENVVYGINPQAHLSNFSNCIVAGNKNLDVVTVEVQKEVSSAQAAVSAFLASVSGAMAAVAAAKEAARAAAEAEIRRQKNNNL